MAAITPEQARAYFRRWELLREEEARQLARTPMETKLRQLAALMASRHLFGGEPSMPDIPAEFDTLLSQRAPKP